MTKSLLAAIALAFLAGCATRGAGPIAQTHAYPPSPAGVTIGGAFMPTGFPAAPGDGDAAATGALPLDQGTRPDGTPLGS